MGRALGVFLEVGRALGVGFRDGESTGGVFGADLTLCGPATVAQGGARAGWQWGALPRRTARRPWGHQGTQPRHGKAPVPPHGPPHSHLSGLGAAVKPQAHLSTPKSPTWRPVGPPTPGPPNLHQLSATSTRAVAMPPPPSP